jgi:hypothetical protein
LWHGPLAMDKPPNARRFIVPACIFGIAAIPAALVVWRPTQSVPDVLDSA